MSGETVVSQSGGLLVIGGLDSSGVSTASITSLDPTSGATRSAGSLSQPLHDAAAATLPGGVLVFGGGSATTIGDVERLVPSGTGRVVGQLPVSRSDLSALTVGRHAYVLAGYDGQQTVGPVLETSDGRSFTTVARLPVPVRYAAVAAQAQKIYVFGGELASGQDSTDIQAVDLSTGRASVIGHLPGPLAHASAVQPAGRIYILGGRLDGSTADQILRFDPSHDRATAAGHLPAAVQNAAAATLDGVGYLVGGLTPQGTPLSSIVSARLISAD